MPISAPLQVDEAWFKNTLIPFLNMLEAGLETLQDRADAVDQSLTTKYAKPSGGIPVSDLHPDALQSNVLGLLNNYITDGSYRNPGLTRNIYNTPERPAAGLPGDFNLQSGIIA